MIGRLLPPPSRFVLAIGNEGGALIDLAAGRVRGCWQVAGHDDAALATLAAPLAAAPRRPVLVVGDLLEQSYRKEAVPQLNPLDRAKVLKRRLERAFPDAPLKAAWRLADDPEEERSQTFLLIGVPPAPDWDRWLDFLRSIDNPVSALTLLPVEATDLVTRLARALTPAECSPSDWTVLIARQQTGGFRQVIVHRGELVLTRLTPTVSGDATTAETVAEIGQELRATLGYMTRLGYRTGTSLDIVLLCEQRLHDELQAVATPPGQRFVLTAAAAAHALGFAGLEGLEGVDGALLGALWLGRKRQPAVQLLPHDLRTRQLQGQALHLATAGLAASALGLLGYSALSAAAVLEIRQEIDWLSAWQGTTEQQLARSEVAPDEVAGRADEMRTLIEAHRYLTARRADPFDALHALRRVMTPGEQLSKLSWQLVAPPDERARPAAQEVDATLDLTLDLGTVSDPTTAVAATEDLGRRLGEVYPERAVTIARQAVDILPHQAFAGGTDLAAGRTAEARLSADLRIGTRER
jgi:hypothetical protein